MVRINLFHPRKLSDQHLIAEYNEILMLFGYIKRYPDIKVNEIPKKYTLNKGHMKFFKDKLLYLKKRHELIKEEMQKRGFKTNKSVNLRNYPKNLHNSWKPDSSDYSLIRNRLIWKINKKPNYYRYYGEYRDKNFFISLISSKNSNISKSCKLKKD